MRCDICPSAWAERDIMTECGVEHGEYGCLIKGYGCGARMIEPQIESEEKQMADMELVIKIPEEVKNRLCFGVTYAGDIRTVCEALHNGTPLQEGHGRLMDADGFINSLKGIERLHIDDELRINILDYINSNILVESEISR